MERRYNILLADDSEAYTDLIKLSIQKFSQDPSRYNVLTFRSGNDLLKYLNHRDDSRQRRYKNVAMIISDLKMPDGDGYDLLRGKNKVDVSIPMYLLSAVADAKDTAVMSKEHLDGYIDKDLVQRDIEYLPRLIDRLLMDTIPLRKEPVLFKNGGSFDDLDIETKSPAMRQAAKFFAQMQRGNYKDFSEAFHRQHSELLQEYQVIINPGAGKAGDLVKTRRRHGNYAPYVRANYPHRIEQALSFNVEYLADLIGRDMAHVLTPSQLKDPEFDLEKFLAEDKVILMGSPPRHLGLGLPIEDSDLRTLLIAELFGIKKPIGFLKRVDGLYVPGDPYQLYDRTRNCWDTRKAKKMGFARLDSGVTASELLAGRTEDGQVIKRIGAWDGLGGHLCEDSALEYLVKNPHLKGISVIHAAPYEMFQDGVHAITGEEKPRVGNRELTEKRLREFNMLMLAAGLDEPDIIAA